MLKHSYIFKMPQSTSCPRMSCWYHHKMGSKNYTPTCSRHQSPTVVFVLFWTWNPSTISFKFQSFTWNLQSLYLPLRWGEYMASVDFQDAHLHVPIYPPHQHFLRFTLVDNHFQVVALPCCLSFATSVLKGPSTSAFPAPELGTSKSRLSSEGLGSLAALLKCQDNLDASGLWWGKQCQQFLLSSLSFVWNTWAWSWTHPNQKRKFSLQVYMVENWSENHATLRFSIRVLGSIVVVFEASTIHPVPFKNSLQKNSL